MDYRIVITDNGPATTGKVADAEIHFLSGVFAGLKLIGFSIWERSSRPGEYNVTFPARTYAVNGERRTFALLRPATNDGQYAPANVRDAIVDAFKADREAATAAGQAM